ncbi:MAG TPA: YoaK family protein [Mucilaginibacter sp.]|jgi:uncharacterized membrane protein YoaK (UPF0700 family)|nr:YoaK family protein [Mucilaginibacter sp.]
MLRHVGQKRTNTHNLRLAVLLCLTAGFVNGAGFLSFYVLVTNVTGHVALFAEKLSSGDASTAMTIGFWMLLFFLGAFVSSFIINKIGRNERYSYAIPILIEMSILIFVAVCGPVFDNSVRSTHLFAGSLLFAMGLQNAMVSMISGSEVRTTHLTGMFTDLGIETAAVTLKQEETEKKRLYSSIRLRLVIIIFFFLGCVTAVFLYDVLRFKIFYIPVGFLIIAMFYDIFRIKAVRAYHHLKFK